MGELWTVLVVWGAVMAIPAIALWQDYRDMETFRDKWSDPETWRKASEPEETA